MTPRWSRPRRWWRWPGWTSSVTPPSANGCACHRRAGGQGAAHMAHHPAHARSGCGAAAARHAARRSFAAAVPIFWRRAPGSTRRPRGAKRRMPISIPTSIWRRLAGFQAIGLSNLFTGDAFTMGAGPAIHLPIFDAGKIRAQYAGATAELDVAVADYNGAVLNAIKQTADAMTQVKALPPRRADQQAALDSATRAFAPGRGTLQGRSFRPDSHADRGGHAASGAPADGGAGGPIRHPARDPAAVGGRRLQPADPTRSRNADRPNRTNIMSDAARPKNNRRLGFVILGCGDRAGRYRLWRSTGSWTRAFTKAPTMPMSRAMWWR